MKIFPLFIITSTFLNLVIGQTANKQNFVLGDHYGGGIIFSIDPTGQHGLIAAPFDQPYYTCWGEEGFTNATFMNEGASNTKKIVLFMKKMRWVKCVPAAYMCDTSTVWGHSDWYLPSINELKEMYDNQKLIGGFVAEDYCSSTESSDYKCWNVHFRPNRKIIFQAKKYRLYRVRCIRKF